MDGMTDSSTADQPPDRHRRALRALQTIEQRTRPDLKRAIPAVIVAVVSFVVGERLGGLARSRPGEFDLFGRHFSVQPGYVILIDLVLAVIFVLSGIIATRSIGNELARVTRNRAGASAASAIRLICYIAGYATVGLALMSLLHVDLSSLLIGGAVTAVVIGIAAQQTLSNFFAGLVLLFTRPYVAGERIRVRTGAMGGPFEGVILAAGLMYTTIHTDEGPVSMPNSGLLAAAIGPAPDPAPAVPESTTPTATPTAADGSRAPGPTL
jgi:small-conductance mechanosensitive channel